MSFQFEILDAILRVNQDSVTCKLAVAEEHIRRWMMATSKPESDHLDRASMEKLLSNTNEISTVFEDDMESDDEEMLLKAKLAKKNTNKRKIERNLPIEDVSSPKIAKLT